MQLSCIMSGFFHILFELMAYSIVALVFCKMLKILEILKNKQIYAEILLLF